MKVAMRVRPWEGIGEFTEVDLNGDSADDLKKILLNVLIRNDWEIEGAEDEDA
jgi:hypothetical protein